MIPKHTLVRVLLTNGRRITAPLLQTYRFGEVVLHIQGEAHFVSEDRVEAVEHAN